VAVTSDQNLLFYSLENSLKRTRQIAGYNEEVLDTLFVGKDDGKLAVVTNTEQIRVYDLATPFCDILYGHSEIVLNVARSRDGTMLVSGSKDRTAMIWRMNEETKQFEKVGVCSGHTETVSAVAMSRKSNSFIVTGSHDMTIKVWDLLEDASTGSLMPRTRFTVKAHDKDIQSITVAPNDKIFASCALDKTAKIWSAADGSLLGTLKGHRRGLWCVRFSPSDQLCATSSTDKTIKLWSLTDFSCIRTFEGHLNSVLHVEFIGNGQQLVSSGSDALIKVWNVKSSECINTLDNHEDKVKKFVRSKTSYS
jgi:U3 small nucleolar RNA-associated protein 13